MFELFVLSNTETSDNGVQADRKDSVKYEYPKTVVQPINQPIATYETVPLHEEDTSETATRISSDVAGPVYSEARDTHGDPRLLYNPIQKQVIRVDE